jgi:hypothetical protein
MGFGQMVCHDLAVAACVLASRSIILIADISFSFWIASFCLLQLEYILEIS